jgi:hypothetical protein
MFMVVPRFVDIAANPWAWVFRNIKIVGAIATIKSENERNRGIALPL